MTLTILIIGIMLIGIMLILALLYIAASTYKKHDHQRCTAARRQYQDHIDDLVQQLFPPTIQAPTVQETDLEYQEAKRKRVADIRTYFNQRKIDTKMPGPDELAPVNPFRGSP